MEKASFKSFGFRQELNEAIKRLYFNQPTDIQRRVIPEVLRGKSVIAESYTGSGKTHAYLLPLLHALNDEASNVQFVITSPTRELATHIYNDIRKITKLAEKKDKWKTRLLVGGTDRKQMINRLKTPPQIIVGTPGRILDFVMSGHLSIYEASSFVIDEA